MAKGNIRWTAKQKEVANLLNEGKTFNDLIDMDYSNGLISKVMKALKQGNTPTVTKSESKVEFTEQLKSQKIGEIVIAPQNWVLSPKGALLILDTYDRAKEELNYGGTITEFLCDITNIFRRWLGYNMEVQYERETTGGELAKVSGEEIVAGESQ
jgi:hypothetical protein